MDISRCSHWGLYMYALFTLNVIGYVNNHLDSRTLLSFLNKP